jgi:hypothetical protein
MLAELRHLVQEEHAPVRQADLARPRPLPATDQPRVRDRVMRRAKRSVADQRHVAGEHAGHRVDARDVQRLGGGHARQDRGQRARKERLTRARRARHQDVMAAGCGDFERSFDHLLALDVLQVTRVRGRIAVQVQYCAVRLDRMIVAEMGSQSSQRLDRIDINPLDERGFGRVGLRHKN